MARNNRKQISFQMSYPKKELRSPLEFNFLSASAMSSSPFFSLSPIFPLMFMFLLDDSLICVFDNLNLAEQDSQNQ